MCLAITYLQEPDYLGKSKDFISYYYEGLGENNSNCISMF